MEHVLVTGHNGGMTNTATAATERAETTTPAIIDLRATVRAYEDDLIRAALEATGRRKKDAADLLGLKRTTLQMLVKRRSL